jgi:hypothetical protein
MECNYDQWTSGVVKSITPRMHDALRVMSDCRIRTRASMLRAAGIDPNPRSEFGFSGFEKTDYYLYKKGLIKFVGMEGQQKLFQITEAGLAVWPSIYNSKKN